MVISDADTFRNIAKELCATLATSKMETLAWNINPMLQRISDQRSGVAVVVRVLLLTDVLAAVVLLLALELLLLVLPVPVVLLNVVLNQVVLDTLLVSLVDVDVRVPMQMYW